MSTDADGPVSRAAASGEIAWSSILPVVQQFGVTKLNAYLRELITALFRGQDIIALAHPDHVWSLLSMAIHFTQGMTLIISDEREPQPLLLPGGGGCLSAPIRLACTRSSMSMYRLNMMSRVVLTDADRDCQQLARVLPVLHGAPILAVTADGTAIDEIADALALKDFELCYIPRTVPRRRYETFH